MQKVLLLHGAIGSKEQLEPLKNLLSKEFDVYSINFSGHGGVALPDKFSIDVFANDVLAFLNMHSVDQIDILGYSMGGYVALYLAANHPQKVGKIFTLATKFDWTEESAFRESKMLDPVKIEEKVPAFAAALRERHYPNDWKKVLSETAGMMIAMGHNPPLIESVLNRIPHKVKLCVGDADKMVSIRETRAVADSLSNAEFYLFAGMPHPIEQIDIQLLAAESSTFLKK